VANSLLTERGAQGITLRDVAKSAGVSHAAPYHHFQSLNALLAAVAEASFTQLGDALALASTEPDTRERLLRITEAYVSHARAQPAQFRLMFGPLLSQSAEFPALQAAARRAFGFVLAAATAHDPQRGAELALTGWSLSHGLSNLLIDGALDTLALPLGDAATLARQLALRALGEGGSQAR
jgi:AcrR family transcriptional regulator